MAHWKCFSLLLVVCAALLFGAPAAYACSCGSQPTVLEAYEESAIVVLVKVIEVKKSEVKAGSTQGVHVIAGATAIVEKVFKGNVKAGDEMIFGQGGGADCVWTFEEEEVGRQFLFYLNARGKNQNKWYVGTCGRSTTMEEGGDDLLYLNKLGKVRGKTRISGTLRFFQARGFDVADHSLRLIGRDRTYELKTDNAGVYEIYDVPAGKYFMELDPPFGWKINKHLLNYSASLKGESEDESLKRIPIVVQDRRHAALDIYFEIDNAIRGRVFDLNGKPMKGVCVKAVAAQTGKEIGFNIACTDVEGKFAITELSPGSYILAVNEDGKISSTEPFGKFYYPNITEPEKATIFTLAAGDFREDVNIHVPRMEETIMVEGVFLYSDGKPVVEGRVSFEPEQVETGIDSSARAVTDTSGRFSLKILKNRKGKLYGAMYSYIGEFENCPKLEEIIKKMDGRAMDIKTPVIDFRAETDLYHLELKYPFPGCEKAK